MKPPRSGIVVALLLLAAAFLLSHHDSDRMVPLGLAPVPRAPSADTRSAPAPVAAAQESVRDQSLRRLAYAQAWNGPLPEPMAAFRTWTHRYLAAPSPAARLALTAEGRALAQARRPAMRSLIVTDPARALAVTVPAAVRAALPAAVLAELETRHAGHGDYTLLASQPAPGEPRAEPALRRIVYLGGQTYTARPYGRREPQLTKENASLHGIALDGEFALHESPLRVLEPGELPVALAAPAERCFGCLLPAEPAQPVAAEVNVADLSWIEFNGTTRRVHASDLAALETAALRAEDLPGPRVASLTGAAELTAADAPTSHTIGTKQVLVIRTDFSDFPGAPLTQPAAQAVLDTAVSPFLESASYGLTKLVTTVSEELYRLPRSGSSYALANDSTALHTDARAAAAAHHTLANFDRIVVLFPNIGTSRVTGSQFTFAGRASIAGTNVWINGPTAFVLATVSHEFGHTYGLQHANLWRAKNLDAVSPEGTTLEYGDPFDMMGSTTATGVTRDARHHYNMWSKNQLGWLPDEAVTTVARSGTYRIHRFDSRTSPRDRPLALRVFRDGVRWYWIGLRQNFSAAGTPRTNGAYVVWGYNQRQQSQLLDLTTPGTSANDAALPLGTTFTDAPYGVAIKPLATGGTEPEQWMDVEITLPPSAPPNVVTAWGRLGATFFDTETGDDILPNPETNVPLDLRGVVALAAGDQHALALRSDDTVAAWGNHTGGQIAVPAGLNGIVAVAAGGHVSGVVKRDGTVQLWGVATDGVTNPPFGLTGVRQLAIGGRNSVGTYHALALKSDGTVVAWGSNSNGQTAVPASLSNVVAIAASDRLSVALRADGTVVRWGVTYSGAVAFPAGLADVTAIASSGGAEHALALKKDGTVVAWGVNSSGQCNVPAGLANVVALATGGSHSLALKSDGTVVAWGLATNASTKVPPGLPRSFALAASAAASFALAGSDFQISQQPAAQVAALGGNAFFSVNALGGVLPSYQWRKNGVAIPGATASFLALTRVTAGDAGSYSVDLTSSGTTLTSAGAALTVGPAPTAATLGRLINLSVLTALSTSNDSFSLGYVVGGAGTSGVKPLLIRAAGPSLAALGVADVLRDPRLELFAGSTKTGENDQWGGAPALTNATVAVGAFPFTGPTSLDAAVFTEIRTRDNSVVVRGTGAGAVIAELYDATAPNAFTLTSARLINVSVLKNLGSSLTVGFVLGGTSPTRILVRVLGPTLGGFGVAGTVADPRLALFNSSSVQQAENNDWNGTAELTHAFTSVGAFALALNSKDAALVTTLPPGAYTVQASGVGGTTGVALVEVYEVP